MAFHLLRAALYGLLAIFSIILIGLTASRIHHTKSTRFADPLHGGSTGFYEPVVALLLSTSIFSLLFSLPLMFCIGAMLGGGVAHYLAELLGIFILFVLYLVGAALFSHKYQGVSSRCRGFFNQCRLLQAIEAWSWINWAIVFFLLLACLAALFTTRRGNTTTRNQRGTGAGTATAAGAGAGAATGAAAGTHHEHKHENAGYSTGGPGYNAAPAAGTTSTTGTGPTHHAGPETRAVEGSGPVSGSGHTAV